jgi:hypothetical protein
MSKWSSQHIVQCGISSLQRSSCFTIPYSSVRRCKTQYGRQLNRSKKGFACYFISRQKLWTQSARFCPMSGVQFHAHFVKTYLSWARYYKVPTVAQINFRCQLFQCGLWQHSVGLTEHHPNSAHYHSLCKHRLFAAKSFRKHRLQRHEYLHGALKWDTLRC